MTIFIFGFGFSAMAAADRLRQTDPADRITATVRTAEKASRLAGVDAHVFDGNAPGTTLGPALRAAEAVILSIPPGADGDAALLQHRSDLDAAAGLQWLCYYSTVGVYGDFDGAWIDETAPLVPRNERSDRRVVAEQAWRDYAAQRGVPLCIVRLAGIYGPGRSTFDKLADGTARRVVKPGQVFNRVHVADIGRVTALAFEAKLDGTFNLADDEPAPPQDLVTYAAELMAIAPPPEIAYEDADFTPMQRSFYADNKRVSNAAIKQALGISLLYPTFRDGLTAIWEDRA